MIPFEIRKIKYPDGKKSVKAVVSLDYAMTKGTTEKLSEIENLFVILRKDCKKQMKKIKKNRGNAKLHWELGDIVCKFLDEIEAREFCFVGSIQSLIDYIGLSQRDWRRHIQLRKEYPDKKMINDDIRWMYYSELMDIADIEKRKQGEELLLKGEINTREEFRDFKKGLDA